MKYRRLGKTGLEVSEISFGTGDNAGLMMNASETERARSLERALEHGINFFDTSPDYGKGAAETNLGSALKTLGADVYIATKVEVMPEDVDDIAGKIVRSAEESLKRLQRDHVDILMIHNPPRMARDASAAHWLPLTPDDMLGPALEGLERVRAAGKARFFGFTCESAEPAATKPLLASGHFHAINCWYNLVNPTAGVEMPDGIRFGADYDDYDGIISCAGDNDVGVAVIRPLAGGALTPPVLEKGAAGRHANAGGGYSRNPALFTPEISRGRAFSFLQREDRPLTIAAYQFALGHPAVSTIVGGFSDFGHLEQLAGRGGYSPLTDSEMARVMDVYRNNFGLT